MVNRGRQIAIVTDEPGWHGRQLKRALKTHGLVGRYVSLIESGLTVCTDGSQCLLPGFETAPPLGVFIRGIPGGSLERVIFRLDILHMLVEQGITVYNTPRAIERTVDKAMTSFLLQQAGIPTPQTWVCESVKAACEIYQRETAAGHALVLKPLFGSQGTGVQMLDRSPARVPEIETGGVFYLQRFVEPPTALYQDMRVFVIDGVAIAAMTRSHEAWITNRAQGGRCERLVISEKIKHMAEDAVRACKIDYAGVDLIVDRHGQLQVLEVNSVPAWWGLQKVVDVNIATLLIDSFIARIHSAQRGSALCQ